MNLLALVLAFFLAPGSSSGLFILFVGAVMFSAWAGGRLAGLAAVVMATWGSNYFALSHGTFVPSYPEDFMRLCSFTLVSLLVSGVNSARASQARAERAQSEAERQQKWLDAVFNLMLTPIVLVDAHSTEVVSSNNAARELAFPLPSAALVGQNAESRASWMDAEGPLSSERMPVQRAARGEVVRGQQLTWHAPTGPRSLLANAQVLGAMHGHPAAVLLSLQDVTELKQAEEALRQSEERYRQLAADNQELYQEARGAERQLRHQFEFNHAIVRSVAEAVCVVDTQGTVVFANPASTQILGWSENELVGSSLHEMVQCRGRGEESPGEGECPLMGVLRTGTPFHMPEDLFTPRDGRPLPVAYTAAPMVEDGQVVGAVLAFHDITRQKQEEEELRRLAAQRATIVSTVSHALRAPMAAMLVNLEVLEDGLLGELNPEQQQYVARTIKSAVDLSGTVDDILTMCRLQDGRVEPRLEEVDVGAELEELCGQLRFRAEAAGTTLELEREHGLESMQTDRRQLNSLFTELIENAIKYGGAGGRVGLTVRRNAQGITVAVADDGPGVPPEELPHLFEPFFRGARAVADQKPGTGLGLSIVHETAKLLGITIEARNRAAGGLVLELVIPHTARAGRESLLSTAPLKPHCQECETRSR